MRLITSILLIFTLVAPFTIKLGVVINYELNIQQITNVFCVNKDKPKMHCNGKCHLAKKLKEISQDDSKQNSNQPINSNQLRHLELIFCQWGKVFKTTFNYLENRHHLTFYSSSFLNNGYATLPFTPPQFLL